MKHHPMCKINLQCLVIHESDICPGPYGKCDCGINATPPQEKRCCINCAADEDQVGTAHPRCASNNKCRCHSKKEFSGATFEQQHEQKTEHHSGVSTQMIEEWESEFDAKFKWRLSSKTAGKMDFGGYSEIKSFISSLILKAKEEERARILTALPLEDDGASDRSSWSAGWGAYREAAIDAIRAAIEQS